MTEVNPRQGTCQHQKTSSAAIQRMLVTLGRVVSDDQAAGGSAPTLAEKINRLFETVHPPERGPYSNAEVERALMQRGSGPTISANYLYLLRSGRKDNPTKRSLEALASFFGIAPAYFFDEDVLQPRSDLELLVALRSNADVRQLALRAFELDPEMCRWLVRIVEDMPRRQLRRRRGAPPALPSGMSDDP